MLSHIAKDLYESYLTEMEPQLGKKEDGGGEAKGGAPALDDQSAKRIRQAVYDIRYRARREDIGIDQAYSQYMSHTSMAANEKAAVREKLGLGPGGQVSEDAKAGEHYLRVDPRKRKTGEKPYVKKFDPANQKDREKRHGLETKGIVTTVTKHGNPYDGAGEKYEKKYGPANGKNTVGDADRDGTVEPDGHEYAGKKDTAIKNKMANKKTTKKESFSSWRDEICEVVEKINSIKNNEKQVKDNSSKHTKVTVNPDVKTEEFASALGAELVESIDLGENYVEQVADFATEYFYAKGLNENGLEILVQEMGEDKFSDYVFYLAEDYFLTEARADGSRIEPVTAKGTKFKSGKPTGKSLERLRAKKAARKESEAAASAAKPSGLTAALKSQSSVAKKVTTDKGEKTVEKAKSSQSPAANKSSEGTKKEVKKGILGHLKQSWQTAREVGREHEARVAKAAGTAAGAAVGAAKAVHRAGQEFGKSKAGQQIKTTAAKAGKAAVGAAGAGIGAKVAGKSNAAALGRAAGTFVRKMKEDFELWIDELIDEGYDIGNYDFADLVELYIPEGIDEGLGTAVSNLLFGTKDQQLARAQKEREARKAAMSANKPQRKEPSTPIRKPNTTERDPWSGNADTDKAWAKGGASTPSAHRAFRREEFEEWMEAFLEEVDVNENMLFLIFESDFMAGEILSEKKNKEGKEQGADGKACWKGYRYAGTENGKDKCVKEEEFAGNYEGPLYAQHPDLVQEKAPPGAKFERMVKHIKAGYAKKGRLTKEKKSIAYATAWKQHNEEVSPVVDKKKL